MTPYDRLLALAAAELELIRAGRLEELPVVQSERAQLAGSLPSTPPASSAPALRRTAALQAEIVAELAAVREATGHELARLRAGRGAVRGYGQVAAMPASAAAARHA